MMSKLMRKAREENIRPTRSSRDKGRFFRCLLPIHFCLWIKCLPRKPVNHRERNRLTVLGPRDLWFARSGVVADANALVVDLVFDRRTFFHELKRIRFGFPVYNHTEAPLFFAKLGSRPTNRK